jgi:hypothetical protein
MMANLDDANAKITNWIETRMETTVGLSCYTNSREKASMLGTSATEEDTNQEGGTYSGKNPWYRMTRDIDYLKIFFISTDRSAAEDKIKKMCDDSSEHQLTPLLRSHNGRYRNLLLDKIREYGQDLPEIHLKYPENLQMDPSCEFVQLAWRLKHPTGMGQYHDILTYWVHLSGYYATAAPEGQMLVNSGAVSIPFSPEPYPGFPSPNIWKEGVAKLNKALSIGEPYIKKALNDVRFQVAKDIAALTPRPTPKPTPRPTPRPTPNWNNILCKMHRDC